MHFALLLAAVFLAGVVGAAVLSRLGLDDFEAWCGGRTAGLVLVTLPAWWLGVAGLRQWRAAGIVLLVGAAVAGLALLRGRRSWRDLAAAEGVFLGATALVLFLRLDHPQIVYQEKPMDLGILASLLRSEGFPPPDMWLAGWTLPYYYWGALLWVIPVAASGMPLEFAYNVLVGLVGGSFAALLWAVGRRIGGSHASGLLTAFLGVLAGTPDGLWQLMQGVSLTAIDPWRSSRQITDTITEFPLFTFWLGDLHPHLLSMPLTALALLVALEAGRRGPRPAHALLLAAIFGVCWAANPWAMPPTLAAVALLLAAGEDRWWWPWGPGIRRWAAAAAVAVGGWLLTAPFHLGFTPFFEGIRAVRSWTDPAQLLLWGGLLVVPAVLAALGLCRSLIGGDIELRTATCLAAAAAVLVIAAASRRPTLVVLAAVLLVMALGTLTAPPGRGRPGLALGSLGVFLLLVPEVLYVADSYGDALHRMNTVFKSYIQGWVLLAAAMPVLLRWGLRTPGRRRLVVALTVVVALLHPARMVLDQLRASELGLDGMHWLPAGDRAIVELLREEPPGTVIIEAVGGAYTEYGRLSAASGVPAYLGWENHEMVWRGNEITAETQRRTQLVNELYSSGDPSRIRELAAEAGAHLVAVGWLERRDFPSEALAAVAAAGEVVLVRDDAVLVRMAPSPVGGADEDR